MTINIGGKFARRDVNLDILAPSISYHTMEQVKASLQSLVSQYTHSAQMYDRPDMECIKITGNLTTSTTKPVIRVVGVEVILALDQYLVTH